MPYVPEGFVDTTQECHTLKRYFVCAGHMYAYGKSATVGHWVVPDIV